MIVTPAPEGLRQEDCYKFESSLVCLGFPDQIVQHIKTLSQKQQQ